MDSPAALTPGLLSHPPLGSSPGCCSLGAAGGHSTFWVVRVSEIVFSLACIPGVGGPAASALQNVPEVTCVQGRWDGGRRRVGRCDAPSPHQPRAVQRRGSELCKRFQWLDQISFLSFIGRLRFHRFWCRTVLVGSLSVCGVKVWVSAGVSREAPQSPSVM